MRLLSLNRLSIATIKIPLSIWLAIVFHLAGFIGIVFWNSPFITTMTSLHLVLMFVLLFISSESISNRLVSYVLFASILGYVAEWIGVHTQFLFGSYSYGTVLGFKVLGVPLVIGLNWAIVLLGSASTMHYLQCIYFPTLGSRSPIRYTLFVVLGGAAIATLFDWIMEPVAITLGYWSWHTTSIPLYNYVCWFLVSALGLLVFCWIRPTVNKFFMYLMLIQTLFFSLLRLSL